MATIEFITKEDLENFKQELLAELRRPSMRLSKQQQQKEWLKSYPVRKLLGISPNTLQSLRVNGILPFTRVGGLFYYAYEDIRMLMDGKKKLPSEECWDCTACNLLLASL